jgi:hypothetical protein
MRSTGREHGTLIGLAGAVGALLLLPSCGALAEAALEQAAEEATGIEVDEESGTLNIEGEDISISFEADDEGGSLSIEGPDGTVQVDADSADGSVNVTSEGFEGEEDQELNFTSDAEIPDGFPLPYPDGGTVESGSTFDTGDTKIMYVTMRYDGSRLDELISFYDGYFEDDDVMTKHDVESGSERTVGYVTNPDGQITGVSMTTQQGEVMLFLETTVVNE